MNEPAKEEKTTQRQTRLPVRKVHRENGKVIKIREGKTMSNTFMRVDEVAEELGVSKSYAYKIVHRLNAELNDLGYLTVSGRVSKKYFLEKVCYGENEKTKKKG